MKELTEKRVRNCKRSLSKRRLTGPESILVHVVERGRLGRNVVQANFHPEEGARGVHFVAM